MKKALVALLLGQLTVTVFASSRLTVDQLNRVIISSHGRPDAKTAERLFGLELSERLSAGKLAALEALLPGPESRRALVVLADQAAFLNPPAAEIPNEPAPSIEQQREITAKAIEYVKTTLNRLPDLFARRDTIRFEDTPAELQNGGVDAPSGIFIPFRPLHPTSRSTQTVLYRDGQEVVQTGGEEQQSSALETTDLTTFGEFGSILSTVFGDLPRGSLTWSHWEQGAAHPAAVFHFVVPKGATHYQVKFCCVNGSVFEQFPAYHGEITIDPTEGTVLRLTLMTDLTKADPITKANLMVEYGPVELGKQSYFCPIKSISLSMAPVKLNHRRGLPRQGTITTTSGPVQIEVQDNGDADAPLQTMLNEVVFDQYHLFHSEARILTAENSEAAAAPNAAAKSASGAGLADLADLSGAATTSERAATQEQAATIEKASGPDANPVAAASATGAAERTMDAAPAATSITTSAGATAAPTEPSTPEMNVTASADLPRAPAAPAGVSAGTGFSLHVSTRLVDIGVTARDKKGRPITGLTQEDFEVYDNGKKQSLRSFSHARAATADLPLPAATVQEVLYSNRLVATGGEQSSGTSVPEYSTIILLDATSLSFGDFTRARERILSFLDRLPSSEAVGLYVRAGYGFRVLGEGTANHAALSSALRGWIPNAQDLARAQEEEMRNRQQFDTVQSPADMQYVNGNIGGTANIASVLDIPGGGADTTSDPKLMKEGSDPTREALTVVVAVAAHLGAVPGHKNLVWVASDNVLANWTDQAAGSDRSSKTIGTFAMRTQEMLNNAHVSLYPLAASELETAATDASLQNDSVQLDPSVAGMYPKASLGDAAPLPGARAKAEMRQDIHPVQAAIQQMAQGTGGRTFNRSDNIAANLNSVIEDGEATYLLSFAPETAPDDQYHQLKVSVPTRGGIVLRYRSGYLFTKEPSTLKERFKEAMWQPVDATEIALSAHRASASAGAAVSLNIAAADISLAQQGERRTGKLDIFLVQRDQAGMRAEVDEQTLALDLKPATYEKVLRDGIPFEQYFAGGLNSGTVRIIVVDETSGRIGTITLPAAKESTGP